MQMGEDDVQYTKIWIIICWKWGTKKEDEEDDEYQNDGCQVKRKA